MIRRSWVQTPLGAISDEIYFVLCNLRQKCMSDFFIVYNPHGVLSWHLVDLGGVGGGAHLLAKISSFSCSSGKYWPNGSLMPSLVSCTGKSCGRPCFIFGSIMVSERVFFFFIRIFYNREKAGWSDRNTTELSKYTGKDYSRLLTLCFSKNHRIGSLDWLRPRSRSKQPTLRALLAQGPGDLDLDQVLSIPRQKTRWLFLS